MKNCIKTFVSLFFVALGVSCTPEETEIAVTSVNLDVSALTLTEGGKYELKATVSPFNAANKKVIFNSGNQSVASVTETGLVTANKEGQTTITVITDDGGKRAECEVTVVAKEYPVTGVKLSSAFEEMIVGESLTLEMTIIPSTASDKSVAWKSSNSSVASVSMTGMVTAKKEGTATITVTTNDGGKTAACEVTVKNQVPSEPQEGDYIDEYGINHGQGVEIDGVVWAPVNCGYHETDFKYGKLYQWGRKYGQGYDGSLYDMNGNYTGTYTDATVPTVKSGPVSLSTGQSESNVDYFYKKGSYPYDWLSSPDDELWNSGTESDPVKTEYDPCPEGWRVPTYEELDELNDNRSSWTTNENGQIGYWFSGSKSYSSSVPRVFFPAAGSRDGYGGSANLRGYGGYYWSSRPNDYSAYYLRFNSSDTNMDYSFRASGYSVRCVQDDGELVPVTSVTLNESSLAIDEGDTYTLSVTISPSDANHKSAHWWSDDESIATVDQTGKVTAVSAGTATITVMAGMKTATCTVTVKDQSVAQEGDYIDEYGINHGQGVEIDGVVWAPVNCGYHKDDFKYGKLYQWGRKYGQGYSGELYDINGNYTGTYTDATVPTVKSGPVSLSTGQSKSNEDYFYKNGSSPYDWLSSPDDYLWNSGTESDPVKTEYDPCPEGWRVPTFGELDELNDNRSSWTTDENGQIGYWFSGSKSYSSSVPRVFFPAAGYRDYYDGDANSRGSHGNYWSSRPNDYSAYYLRFNSSDTIMDYSFRASGYSVRCVQDDGELVPVTSVTLNESSLIMDEGDTYTLSASISPSDANHQSAHWWSDDESVVTVDQSGVVTAVSAGTATITAMAGMKTATCTVTVKDQSVAQEGDYIDEYGVNHGQGVEIGGVVWAPVNCGYHETDFKYGKLYQWGRKYGQGYDGELYDINGNKTGTYADATVPIVTSGPVSLSTGQSKSNEDYFYKNGLYPYDWLSSPDDELWNSGTESDPVKTEYDPCPEGWRVPTYEELDELNDNRSSWTTDENGQIGYWFSGSKSYSSSVPRVFFPAAGNRNDYDGTAYNRGYTGYYWSSRPSYYYGACSLYFNSSNTDMYSDRRARGYSVRCVQIID